MADPDTSIIKPLKDVTNENVGGKAKGLAQLMTLGLDVPDGFVIINARAGEYPEDLLEAYKAIGGAEVAVRSSALGEDAGDNSFAGQFETILNVKGEMALKQAIDACVNSLQTDRAAAYQQNRDHEDESIMCVVVQNMVNAAYAGVLFTADPMSGRHDRLVIDVVQGLGESLVSGEASSDHYLLANDDTVVEEILAGEDVMLHKVQVKTLAHQAREAASRIGEPLDMEWAIDESGKLFWLQARPITTIGTDLNELDTHVEGDHVLTRCNVGEILPGASCPLTYSVQGWSIDLSLQYLSSRFSGQPFNPKSSLVEMAYVSGYLFINMSEGLKASRYTLLSRAETAAQSICGRTIPELKEPEDKKSLLRRLWGIRDFIVYTREAQNQAALFAQKLKTLHIEYQLNSEAMYKELDKKRQWLFESGKVHMCASALSGALEGVVQGIITKGAPSPSLEQQAMAAKLFAGATDVESAVLVDQLDKVVGLIANHPQGKEKFFQVSPTEAYRWVVSESAGPVTIAFQNFLESHGHRSYKELCLMEQAWIDEPEKLIESMQASLAAYYQGAPVHHLEDVDIELVSQPLLIRWLLPKVHAAIRRREHTKSMMVKVTHLLKRGYRELGKLLEKEGMLEDFNLVYFFTHEELADFVTGKAPEMAEHVKKRQLSYEFQQRLSFPDISVGLPQPIEKVQTELVDGQLAGRPVSKGVIEGIARVAHNIREAAELQPGEILIAPVTDVGWTPYFSLIAGLATDVGSAVSHGAVIAREYGLPCIVNMQVATSTFKTGDRVRLDADTGIMTRLEHI